MGQKIGPASTIGPTGLRRNSNSVTMPKLPPPPRSPQKSSGFSVSLALTSSPSAVTRSTDRSWSMVSPYLRISQLIPPPKASPESPVCVTMPDGTAVTNREAREAVPPATHSNQKAIVLGELHGRDDVGDASAPRDEGRETSNRPVPHLASILVAGVLRAE